jgi:putative membrane protein
MLTSRLLVTIATGVLVAATAATPVRAAPAEPDPTGPCQEDVKYLVRAHRGNLAETAAGAAAMVRSTDMRVHRLAGMLIVDHTGFDVRVTDTADRHDVALPPKPTRQQRADLAAVVAERGPAFDLAWLRLQVTAHTQTLDFIDRERRDGCDADVTALAAKAEKTVEAHLAAARKVLDELAD